MASDYGDEAGEKLFDWMARIGQNAGVNAMESAADKFATALHHAKGSKAETLKDESGKTADWGKLDLSEFSDIEGYPELKDILSTKLRNASVEHVFFNDEKAGKEHLLFRMEDAPKLAAAFDELIESVDKTRADVRETLQAVRGKEKARDAQPLDDRAAQARKASDAIAAERTNTKTHEFGSRFQENQSK